MLDSLMISHWNLILWQCDLVQSPKRLAYLYRSKETFWEMCVRASNTEKFAESCHESTNDRRWNICTSAFMILKIDLSVPWNLARHLLLITVTAFAGANPSSNDNLSNYKSALGSVTLYISYWAPYITFCDVLYDQNFFFTQDDYLVFLFFSFLFCILLL